MRRSVLAVGAILFVAGLALLGVCLHGACFGNRWIDLSGEMMMDGSAMMGGLTRLAYSAVAFVTLLGLGVWMMRQALRSGM